MDPRQHRSTPSSPPTMEPFQPYPGDSVHPSTPTNALELIKEMYGEIDPVEEKTPSMRNECSESMNPGHHGSISSSPPTMEPSQRSPVDSFESIREMYDKINPEKQIDPLISFIENQIQTMNIPSEPGSIVPDGSKLAAKTVDIISTESERPSKSDAAIERYRSVNSTGNECKELLLKIHELAKGVKQYAEQMPDDREKLCNAFRTVVEGAYFCSDYLQKKFKFWSAKKAAEQLEKTNQQLTNARDSLGLSVGLQILKQSTMPIDQSSFGLLDFQWRKDYLGDKDVFLSHSGKQKNFVRQLHRDLTREHVSSFFDEDDNSLPLAHKFPPLIFKAAETCKIAVLVLSKEFIRSKWPMLELSAFISAKNSGKNGNVKLLPIFFMISPKELSKITKDSPEWQDLEVNDATRGEWQNALKEVRSINGLHFDEGENEVGFRDKIVKEIRCLLSRINPKTPQLLDFEPVGIEEQVAEVKALMDMEGTQSALAVIVCGFGGVGKSTLAASVVQSLDWSSSNFKFCWVAIDEKASDKTSHIIKLQKEILYNLGGVKLDLQNPDQGRVQIKEALQKNCSLLFIDNVVDKDYIRDLLPKDLSSSMQKRKLRILITSREEDVKAKLNINWQVYEVRPLSKPTSRLLLSDTILQGKVVEDKDFHEKTMINEVADACRGVPLLLSVFGEHLRTERDKDSYQEALNVLTEGNLDSYRDEDLGKKLMFVYHKIKNEEVREAFLDICTYFHGWKWDLVADIVDFPNLKDLRRRMLVSKSGSGEVIVHDILRLMGRKDARPTRFLDSEELSDALENNSDSFGNVKDVKGISLVNDEITIPSTKMEAMRQSLRVLMLGDWVTLDGSPFDKPFTNLRYLRVGDITVFPFKDLSKQNKLRVFLNRSKLGMDFSHLPSSLKRISHEVPDVECDKSVKFPFQNLSELKSFMVKTQKSVELPKELHLPASLVDLHLNRCKNLPKDIGHLTALESLILDGSDLERLPQGFGKLKKLKHLSMDYCSKLAFLPEELGMLCSLEVLSIHDCGRNWRALPESFGGLLSLKTLKLTGCINLRLLPESFGELRIHSLKLDSLVKVHDLPNSMGNMCLLKDLILQSCDSLLSLPNSFVQLKMLETLQIIQCTKLSVLPEEFGRLLLKDFRLISCDSLMSLPNSFVQLKMLETLQIIQCTKLSVLPEYFGRLRCLKHITVEKCNFLKELPHGFGALSDLKTFSLRSCTSLVNLSRDFGDLTSLEELRLEDLPLISRIPDGLGKLKKLRFLSIGSCFQLKTLPDDFENMATLERLSIPDCPELDGAMMEKILKLPNCDMADIDGSIKLSEKWEHIQGETEHPIVVDTGDFSEELLEREAERAMKVALLRGKYMEVKNGTDQLVERLSLLVGLEEGKSATVALIVLPIRIQSHQHPALHQFVERAREIAANGSGELQIVCARKPKEEEEGHTPTEEEKRAEEEEGIRQILLSLPKGSCAIPSTEYKRVKILTGCCELYGCDRDKLGFLMANVVDIEGRKRFENFKFIEENEMWEPLSCQDSMMDFVLSICGFFPGQSETESKTGELIEALKGSGIEYLVTDCNRSKVAVDDLNGKVIGIILNDMESLKYTKLPQIYKDLQQKDPNFIAIWIPTDWPTNCGYGSYRRLIRCMPWATFPRPHRLSIKNAHSFVLLDQHGQIANHDAMPLLLGWSVQSYPFSGNIIRECLFSMESDSCLEFLLHGMNIVGRKPLKSKITFLYATPPNDWRQVKCELEEITQIQGSFEVLYVGKLLPRVQNYEDLKQEYEGAIQHMPWPALSFSDMIMFWRRCEYLMTSNEACELLNESKTMRRLHDLAWRLSCHTKWLALVDKEGVVTSGGYEVLQMICEPWDEMSEGERMVKVELMKSLRRGECSPLVKQLFRDETMPDCPADTTSDTEQEANDSWVTTTVWVEQRVDVGPSGGFIPMPIPRNLSRFR